MSSIRLFFYRVFLFINAFIRRDIVKFYVFALPISCAALSAPCSPFATISPPPAPIALPYVHFPLPYPRTAFWADPLTTSPSPPSGLRPSSHRRRKRCPLSLAPLPPSPIWTSTITFYEHFCFPPRAAVLSRCHAFRSSPLPGCLGLFTHHHILYFFAIHMISHSLVG
jgi:hypothetical protein